MRAAYTDSTNYGFWTQILIVRTFLGLLSSIIHLPGIFDSFVEAGTGIRWSIIAGYGIGCRSSGGGICTL